MCCCDPYAEQSPICCQCCDPYAVSSEVVLNVPAGSSHDFWLGTRTGITSLRAQADTDFDISTEFLAAPPADAVHGLIIGDAGLFGAGQFIRFDVFTGAPTIFAANDTGTTFPGGPPAPWIIGNTHLRVRRIGNTFDCFTSPDGSAWVLAASIPYIMTVTQLGVWAGNFGTNPAHTAIFTGMP